MQVTFRNQRRWVQWTDSADPGQKWRSKVTILCNLDIVDLFSGGKFIEQIRMWYFSCEIKIFVKITKLQFLVDIEMFYDFRISQRRIGSNKMRSIINISTFVRFLRFRIFFSLKIWLLRTFIFSDSLQSEVG